MVGPIKRKTTNYQLNIPRFDVPEWGTLLERNFDVIDAVLFLASGVGSVVGTWTNATIYAIGDRVVDPADNSLWECGVSHTSATFNSFSDDRAAHPTFWDPLQSNFVIKGPWQAATQYQVGDTVTDTTEHVIAYCTIDHVSSANIRTDVANWAFIADLKADLLAAGASVTAAAAQVSAAAAHVVTAAGHAAASLGHSINSSVSAAASAASAVASANSILKEWRGQWVTARAYGTNDAVFQLGSSYICLVAHTSGTFATDLAGGKWDLLAQQGATGPGGPGGGNMLASVYDPGGVANNAFDMLRMVDNTGSGGHLKMTNAERTKLAGIEAGAEVNDPPVPPLTDSQIASQYENNANRNPFTDALESKLIGIQAGADVTSFTNVNAALNDASALTLMSSAYRMLFIQSGTTRYITYTNFYNQVRDDLIALFDARYDARYNKKTEVLVPLQVNDLTNTYDARYASIVHHHFYTRGAIGSYALAVQSSGAKAANGGTTSGANLEFSSADGGGGGVLSGTWRLMGTLFDVGSGPNSISLWQRTA